MGCPDKYRDKRGSGAEIHRMQRRAHACIREWRPDVAATMRPRPLAQGRVRNWTTIQERPGELGSSLCSARFLHGQSLVDPVFGLFQISFARRSVGLQISFLPVQQVQISHRLKVVRLELHGFL